jgi:hypothetical protein
MAYRKDWPQPAQGGQGFARTMKCFGRKCNINVNDMNTLGNVVGLFMIPKDFVVTGMIGPQVPAFGTSFAYSLGDAGSGRSAAYLGATSGAVAAALPAMAFNANPLLTGQWFRTFADTEVQLTVTTAATAAQVAGILELYFTGFIL